MVNGSDSEMTTTVLYVIVVVVAILIGTVLAPVTWGAFASSDTKTDSKRPSVAVITLRGGTNANNAAAITKDLRQARQNSSIEAVVLRIDSNGGPVSPSEELYLAMNRTASQMPVVAYVEGSAASGGYMTIAPSDAIYVKPSSIVGSIGVIVQAPLSQVEQVAKQRETLLRTGPDKAQISKDGIRQELESLHNAFTNIVMEHRSDELKLSRQEVMSGKAYLGATAVQNGYADKIGDLHSAIQRAAKMSNAINGTKYDVVYKEPPQQPINLFGASDVEKVEGNIVYVDTTDEKTEFEQPVKFYAVYGVPVDEDDDDDGGLDTEEVTPNGTD